MKKPRRAPFVITVAIAAVGSACGGSTEGGGGGSGGTGSGGSGGYGANPPNACPDLLPDEGTGCPPWTGGSICNYPDPCGGTEMFRIDCDSLTATWHYQSSTDCSACPTNAPTVGNACTQPSGTWCSYPGDGCCPDEFQCVSGKWALGGVSCNPPPVVCPDEAPANGSPCEPCSYGTCNYQCNEQAKSYESVCVGGTWQVTELPCVGEGGAGGGGGT